jgi:DNA-binding CsgD family transcriptional regulator
MILIAPGSGQVGGTGIDQDSAAALARLSTGQVECLLLVNQHLSSKEIAVRLGISPHTVDQRIRGSLEKLGVERRGEAARIVAAAVDPSHEAYQRLIHQSPHIDRGPAEGQQVGAVSHQIRHADRAGKTGSSGIITEQRPGVSWSSLPLPFATRSQPSNEMSVGFRLLWIVLIAIGATFSAGMYLAGLESLSRLIRG